ncbi:LysR family transcriptional regulator [Burkholderia lata]|uniref:Transcriptional regulator, LysR family n=1 Tax=Burkholderia lata (strain ATCC 17760 / DSM 23089 / LMG 22485 / NCIMB 9086 / R18194 / 383) TaxID=482957 RepID=Q39GB3_BURL3|nr:LysR family transcriptional regulator [Burkholderia lata]ABB08503.1 transcriptional regulator, LysR family [Burkholderia lata]
MDSFALNVFVQAADTRSFVAAGRVLGISASGIGKSVTRLEQSLGVRLFHRSTRSVALTTEGALFLERARRILAEFDAAQAELSEASSVPRGRLRIGLPMVGDPFLPVFSAFRQRYPEIELDLDFDNRMADIIEEGYDAVVRSGDVDDSRLTARPLGRFRMMLVGAPDYFARRGTPSHPRELVEHDCIQFRMPNTGKLQTWQLRCDAGDEPELRLPTAITCNTNEARMYFAITGVGIAYASEFSAKQALEAGQLVTVLDDYTAEQNTFQLLWPSGRHVTPRLRAFIDFVSEHVQLDKTRS